MTIETSCQRCPTWVRIVTTDDTTEAEASRLADRCYCLACGIERMVEHTTHHEAMRETSHVLPPENATLSQPEAKDARSQIRSSRCPTPQVSTPTKTNANVL